MSETIQGCKNSNLDNLGGERAECWLTVSSVECERLLERDDFMRI
jgi:hypothetical protein